MYAYSQNNNRFYSVFVTFVKRLNQEFERLNFAYRIVNIANPLPLIYHLLSNYRIIGRLEFRDHHNFTSSEVSKINRLAKKWPKAVIYTTEKDAQRLMEKSKLSENVKTRLFYILELQTFFGHKVKQHLIN